MPEKKKSIGNEQPLPIDIIIDSIIEYLETKSLHKASLLLKVKEIYTGDNRAKKATNAIYSVITKKSALNKALINNFTPETFYRLDDADKKTIVMALICLRFPFTYDFLLSLSKLFNVQDTVNRKYIINKMASLYGSNLSLEHGIAAALATAIDCDFIKREKPELVITYTIKPNICDVINAENIVIPQELLILENLLASLNVGILPSFLYAANTLCSAP